MARAIRRVWYASLLVNGAATGVAAAETLAWMQDRPANAIAMISAAVLAVVAWRLGVRVDVMSIEVGREIRRRARE